MTVASASVSPSSGVQRSRGAHRAAPAWASGVVTGLESVVLSAGLVLALAFATVASTPAADGSVSADWVGAWDVATAVWLLAHGVPASAGAVTVTLLPLGLLLVAGMIAASVARRLAVAAHASVLCAGLAYGAVVAVIAVAEGGGAGVGFRAGLVGALVCGTGASLGLKRARGFRFWGGVRLPAVMASGLRLGGGACALCLAVGAATATAWQIVHWGEIGQSARRLDPDLAGGLALSVGETAYVPTMAVWALSWLSGAGFAVGAGSQYSTGEVIQGAVPSLPLLGALPAGVGGALIALPAILVAIGMLVRASARRWLPPGGRGVASQCVGAAVLAALVWGVATAASGSIGAGVLSEVGPRPSSVALAVTGLVAAGMLIASLVAGAWRGLRPRAYPPGSDSVTPLPRAVSPSQPPRTRQNSEPLQLW